MSPSLPVAVASLLCGLLTLTACQSQSRPGAVEPGQYAALASSTGITPTGATLELTNADAVLRSDTNPQTSAFAGPSDEFLLCPPSGHGVGTTLQTPLTIGGQDYLSPMIFGDCGATRPARVTIVDLASLQDPNENSSMPFSRWTEFCKVGTPDCPAP